MNDEQTKYLSEYVSLIERKKDLEAALNDCKGRISAIEEGIVEAMQSDGMQSININGFTVYLNNKMFASAAGDKADMIAAMTKLDPSWSALVEPNVNSNRLSARVRELELDEMGNPVLPSELKDLIKVSIVTSLGARASKK